MLRRGFAVLAVMLAALTLAVAPGGQPGAVANYPLPYSIYLPMVAGGSGSTLPTATPTTAPPTVTPSPIPCSGSTQVLVNPSFESGFTGWQIVSGIPVLRNTASADGQWSVLFGGYSNARDVIAQSAVVPQWADSAIFAFWWYMLSDDSAIYPYDSLTGAVADPSGSTILAERTIWNNGSRGAWYWAAVSVPNVVAYRGQSLRVMVAGFTDSSYTTGWWVDNVRLVFACGSGATSAQVQPSSTPVAPPSDQDWRRAVPATPTPKR